MKNQMSRCENASAHATRNMINQTTMNPIEQRYRETMKGARGAFEDGKEFAPDKLGTREFSESHYLDRDVSLKVAPPPITEDLSRFQSNATAVAAGKAAWKALSPEERNKRVEQLKKNGWKRKQ